MTGTKTATTINWER